MWMGLIKLGLAIVVTAGAFGLTVSAGDLPGPISDLRADSLMYDHSAALPGAPLAYERVEIPEAGLALEVPMGWQQLDREPAWSPTGDGEKRIGVSWFHLLSAVRPEAVLLPNGGLIVASAPIALEWGAGRQYVVKSYSLDPVGKGGGAPAISVENHMIITVAGGETQWVYDLHAVAPTEEELAALKPVLETMLGSMYLTAPFPAGSSR